MKMLLVLLCTASCLAENHKVFVVDKVRQVGSAQGYGNQVNAQTGEYHTALVVMSEFGKRCHTVSFTKDAAAADFILETQSGGSSLSDPKGNVLYVSPAKQLHNMEKDMCAYISAH
jgi:hypothetical protein